MLKSQEGQGICANFFIICVLGHFESVFLCFGGVGIFLKICRGFEYEGCGLLFRRLLVGASNGSVFSSKRGIPASIPRIVASNRSSFSSKRGIPATNRPNIQKQKNSLSLSG
ncbi:hypothetical protein ACTSEZ_17385 [Metabacillus sp. JX24]|uniref:hypothetical protein n=1 Tax=Metabacillus sp. JX24 TaxID=3240759 RepID=UPI00350FC403